MSATIRRIQIEGIYSKCGHWKRKKELRFSGYRHLYEGNFSESHLNSN